MTLTATLSQPAVSVRPGEQVLLEVTVRNRGTVVDRYSFAVMGDANIWARVEPPTLNLMPGAEGSVFIRFDVPRSAHAAAAEVPFAVKVTSEQDSEGSICEEGVLTVGAFVDVFAEIVPRTVQASRVARCRLAVDNRGNTRLNATVSAGDPNEMLAFSVQPAALVAEPGATAFAAVKIRPRKTFLRGVPQQHQFQVLIEPEGQAPLVVNGTFLQTPAMAAWVPRAALALVAALALLVIAWFTLLKPAVTSAAKTVVREPLARTNAAVNEIGAAVGRNAGLPTEGDAVVKAGDKSSPSTTAPVAPGGSGAAAVTTNFGNPFDRRLAVDKAGLAEDSFVVPGGTVFLLTDVVFGNPAGDTGTIALLRGDQIVFNESLANFRNLDYHFVSPIVFDEGTTVTLRVDCKNVGTSCTGAAHLSGFVKNKPSS